MTTAWKTFPYPVDHDPEKPGRVQSWFSLETIEQEVKKPLRWVYTNRIAQGAIAGAHTHLEHEVAVATLAGTFEVYLRDQTTGTDETYILRPESVLFTIPKNVYHEVRNVGDQEGIILVFSNTKPREEHDTIYEQNT